MSGTVNAPFGVTSVSIDIIDISALATYVASVSPLVDGSTITGLIGCLRQFSANNRNGFKLGKFSSFQYPWQDFHNFRKRKIEKTMIDAYKRRSYFNFPHKHYRNKPFILTTEELATVFHFPGKVIATPTLSRVPSRKAEPPANLPV